MGTKGDRAAKEPLAKKMYADGTSLAEISRQLDISDTTLRRWKSEDKVPGEDIDGWDKARQQKRSYCQRLRDVYDEQLKHLEELNAIERNAQVIDAISKLGALVHRWEAYESEKSRPDIDRPKIFLENLEWIAQVLRDMDPEGLKILARNFDALIVKFKAEYAQAT